MIDEYKLMQGIDLYITPDITLHPPRLRDVFDVGEEGYFTQVASFVATPSDFKVELDDVGINFEELSDFALFCSRLESFSDSIINKLVEGIDFRRACAVEDRQTGDVYVCDPTTGALLDEIHYNILCEYLRSIHGFKKNHEVYGNEFTRKMVIDIERDTRQHKAYKEFEPFLLNMVSGLINCSESKYDYNTVWDIPYFVFINSVRRVQKVMDYKAAMSGIYSGNVDVKKINFEKISWIGELE